MDHQNLGWIVFLGLATTGLATNVVDRAKLALESYRSGNRLELVRSTIVALVMALLAAAACYGVIVRVVATARH